MDESGLMSNHSGPVNQGIFQGGYFQKIQDDLKLAGSEILYIGDHIYGDVVSIKKECAWRTALVLGDLEEELKELERARPLQENIDRLNEEKLKFEKELNQLDISRYEGKKVDRREIFKLFEDLDRYNVSISEKLDELRKFFNPYRGEILRAGSEESRYDDQVERYACIYMTKVSDLYDYSPKTYFRPDRRVMPHEQV